MTKTNPSIIIWLFSGCILIFIMVIIGGLTRLTGSGLSMVDWNLVKGVVPPLTAYEWQETFNMYKQYPEYKIKNYNISLSEFKTIFFWEYLHRMIGRLLGLVFIIPFVYFLITKQLNKKLIIRTSILLFLGSTQAFLGWWMVKSGLVDKPDVSHFRLAAHLTTAFITFSYTFWIILTLVFPNKKTYNKKLYRISSYIVVLLLIQIIYGAFVAGLEAGKIYNTWPKMNDKWIAESVYAITPVWRNFTEGLAGIQFVHRTLAFIILFLVIYFYTSAKKINLNKKDMYAVNTVSIIVLLQIFFGVLALINSVPIWLGSIHQILAFFLLASCVYCIFIFKKTV